MKPIIKWAGGKSSEINKIKSLMPEKVERYIEPFLGGGALYFNLENKRSIVNDFSSELIGFYKIIVNNLDVFKEKVLNFNDKKQFINNMDLSNIDVLKEFSTFFNHPKFEEYLKKELDAKEKTRKKLQEEKEISEDNIQELQKTALISTLYKCIRYNYNQYSSDIVEHIFSWFIMRELSYSGMFRYSKKGDFNVPYGGMSYNKKDLINKINYMETLSKCDFYNKTEFNNLDFEDLFIKYNYFNKNDFIFLDPPYDSEFSQYNKEKDFDKEDQIRLKNTLLKTQANIMVVIKNTEFIYDLYKDEFNISSFDKEYSVNFMNRNQKEVKHLIIKNY